jgi:hypothetical protein
LLIVHFSGDPAVAFPTATSVSNVSRTRSPAVAGIHAIIGVHVVAGVPTVINISDGISTDFASFLLVAFFDVPDVSCAAGGLAVSLFLLLLFRSCGPLLWLESMLLLPSLYAAGDPIVVVTLCSC